jgi:allantoinase
MSQGSPMLQKPYADHHWYAFRAQQDQPGLHWQGGAAVGIHLMVNVQSYPLEFRPPMPVLGGLDRPYPDLCNWTQRQVGLRDGLHRILQLLDSRALAATVIVDEDSLSHLEPFSASLRHSRYAMACGGWNAARLHAGYKSPDDEARAIQNALRSVQSAYPEKAVESWHPASGVHSPHTLEALAQSGVRNLLDMSADELPYEVRAKSGNMLCIPWQHFASDLHCVFFCKQPTQDYLADIQRGVEWLIQESQTKGPRMISVPVHPWILGTPHRFHLLESLVDQLAANPLVAFVNAREVVEATQSV